MGKVGPMNGHKQRWKGCLLALLLMVGIPTLIVWRELHRDRLSTELMATVKDVLSISKEYFDDEKVKTRKKQVKEDEAKVLRLLREGADPNARDFPVVKRTLWEQVKFLVKRMLKPTPPSEATSRSALAIAVQADDTPITLALLKAGASDVNAQIKIDSYSDDTSPLINYAASDGNLEIVQELCTHGADIHKLNSQGESLLETTLQRRYWYRASGDYVETEGFLDYRNRVEIYHFLLAKGAKYEPNSKEGYALLCTATQGDFQEISRELLASGVPVNARNAWLASPVEDTPLNYAVRNDDLALVTLLLQHGASTRNAHSESPILSANSPDVARQLLQHGADIQAKQIQGKRAGENALDFACIEGDTRMLAFLLEHGLDANSGTAILTAAGYGGVETVRMLLDHGAKVGPNSPGESALADAIGASDYDSAKLLLERGAAVNIKEHTPLATAVGRGNEVMVLELLKRGANVNADKGAALRAACEDCDEDLVDILLQHGADPTVRDDAGTTTMQLARKGAETPGDADGIIALLKEYGAKR